MSIISRTLKTYLILFHTYLDLLPLNFVCFVLENGNSVLENNISLAVDCTKISLHCTSCVPHVIIVYSRSIWHTRSICHAQAGGDTSVVGYGNTGSMDTYAGAQTDTASGLTNIQKQVSMVIRSCRDEQGMSISSVCDRLRGMPQNAIRWVSWRCDW